MIIHLGGVAQLALLTGNLDTAFRTGSLPFWPVSALKIGLSAALVAGVSSKVAKFL